MKNFLGVSGKPATTLKFLLVFCEDLFLMRSFEKKMKTFVVKGPFCLSANTILGFLLKIDSLNTHRVWPDEFIENWKVDSAY